MQDGGCEINGGTEERKGGALWKGHEDYICRFLQWRWEKKQGKGIGADEDMSTPTLLCFYTPREPHNQESDYDFSHAIMILTAVMRLGLQNRSP
ncbi:hypothetical protein E2542_SST18968 [Spatholobus suberectus]|nr:hypothetical protein E2542_SST18968 [Spatholobus suberectus]